MNVQFHSTIVLSLAHRANSRRAKAAVKPPKKGPPTLHINLPKPTLVGPLQQRTRPGEKWQREIENLLQAVGRDRLCSTAKRTLINFVVDETRPSKEGIRDYIWVGERFCDHEFVEILAETANRCFVEGYIDLGLPAVEILAREDSDYARAWLQWLLAEVAGLQVAESVQAAVQRGIR
jgi:hypothetical protein